MKRLIMVVVMFLILIGGNWGQVLAVEIELLSESGIKIDQMDSSKIHLTCFNPDESSGRTIFLRIKSDSILVKADFLELKIISYVNLRKIAVYNLGDDQSHVCGVYYDYCAPEERHYNFSGVKGGDLMVEFIIADDEALECFDDALEFRCKNKTTNFSGQNSSIKEKSITILRKQFNSVIKQNYPNPVLSYYHTTIIPYEIGQSGIVSLEIVQPNTGHLIRSLAKDKYLEAGNYSVEWNKLDDYSNPVPDGVYGCRLKVDNAVVDERMIVIMQ